METNNKLREACANIAEYARSAMCHTTDAYVLGYLNQIEGWAKAALAAPPRNCDIGTTTEQSDRMRHFCLYDQGGCGGCSRRNKGMTFRECVIDWGQMPYEAKEGGNDADE
ncbi:MAG: hypothetical protein II265_03535 [Clostridia bacterium]|nr:hypothetical protein [Clostridia bacterium]